MIYVQCSARLLLKHFGRTDILGSHHRFDRSQILEVQNTDGVAENL